MLHSQVPPRSFAVATANLPCDVRSTYLPLSSSLSSSPLHLCPSNAWTILSHCIALIHFMACSHTVSYQDVSLLCHQCCVANLSKLQGFGECRPFREANGSSKVCSLLLARQHHTDDHFRCCRSTTIQPINQARSGVQLN